MSDQTPPAAAPIQSLREIIQPPNNWTRQATRAIMGWISAYHDGEPNWSQCERVTELLNQAAIRLAEMCHDDPQLKIVVIVRDGIEGRTTDAVQVEQGAIRWINAHKSGNLDQPEVLAAIQRLDDACVRISKRVKLDPRRRHRVSVSLVKIGEGDDRPL